jgi:hypothetical protein
MPPDANKKRLREYSVTLKTKVIEHYGGKCACCGEKEFYFLTVDHINNDGHLVRKEDKDMKGKKLYLWIIRNNYPVDLQILCFNCNCGKNANGGVCPHKLAPYDKAVRVPD